ncbi:MAG: Trk family potassium uptake protein [Ruminococcus sp.]|nr:Trk family potassium uptake protein [Ruminococcus sp.]
MQHHIRLSERGIFLKQKTLKEFVNRKGISYPKIAVFGFVLVIIAGTFLLMLPVSSRSHTSAGFFDAFFTATSATCITGLVVCDTYTHWSLFGQTVILLLIQTGGLGFMTVVAMFSLIAGKRIGLRERGLLQESINLPKLGDTVKTIKTIICGTFIIEAAGALVLSFRLVPELGAAEGIYNSVFLSVSAFCNSGFDLNGRYAEYSSLTVYRNDFAVLIPLMLLIISGSIGFPVWNDIKEKKLKLRRYTLNSKLALTMTAVLTLAGAVLFFIFEQHNTLSSMNIQEKIISSFFLSVSPRTAGFNTVELTELSPSSKLLHLIYMFIGGNPVSMAGGAKTTTVAVVFLYAWSSLRNHKDCNIFGRRLEDETLKKAVTIISINVFLIAFSTIIISSVEKTLPMNDIVFEVFSAVTTGGMTMGITRDLSVLSKTIVLLLMFCGRVGSISFILLFAENKKYSAVKNPTEKISIG